MSTANSVLKITDINFDGLRNSFIQFLEGQNDFKDYDFEGSTMSTLLDLLAYNTYYNAMYTNFASNEMFLDSAIIRENVVSRAKMLGYLPGSASGSRAILEVTITPEDQPESITIPKDTEFTTTVDGITYEFVTPRAFVIDGESGSYTGNVEIIQGSPTTQQFFVNPNNPVKYQLTNENIDIDSLQVQVQVSESNTTVETYNVYEDVTVVTGNTAAYFISETGEDQYEIEFGNGVIGKKPILGNLVLANYRTCAGDVTNGANTFSAPEALGGYASFNYSTVSSAVGGGFAEEINSIKFNAPKFYQSQNRLVTPNDFKTIITGENADVESVSVWGGQQNVPPVYGKVYIATKPSTGTYLSELRKREIAATLESRSVQSIEPVIVDPLYLFLTPTITAIYDPALTTDTGADLINLFKQQLISFEDTTLNEFKRTYFGSTLTRELAALDPAILGVDVDIDMQKRFTHDINLGQFTYVLDFENPVFHPQDGYIGAISSSGFVDENGFTLYVDDDGFGTLRYYYLNSANIRVYTNTQAGSVDYNTGQVILDAFNPTSIPNATGTMKINATAASQIIEPKRAQVLVLADSRITVENFNTGVKTFALTDRFTSGDSLITTASASSASGGGTLTY
jgi:hypothetical protein